MGDGYKYWQSLFTATSAINPPPLLTLYSLTRSLQVAEALRLATLAPRPWRVEMVDVSAYGEPVTRATQWLMVSSQQP